MKNENIMNSIEKLHEKVDHVKSKVHKIDINIVRVEGQIKVMNGQVKRNKEDIQGIKGFVYKAATGIAAVIGTGIAGISQFIRS